MASAEIVVAARIVNDLLRLDRSASDIKEGVAASEHSEYRRFILAGVALALQGAYSGLERTFLLISVEIDQFTMTGERWHQQLLRRMGDETERRSAVVSEVSSSYLDELLQFRHVIRNIYAFELDYDRIEAIAREFEQWFQSIRYDLMKFAEILDRTTSADT